MFVVAGKSGPAMLVHQKKGNFLTDKKMLLGEALIDAAIISKEQLQKAMVAQKRFPNHSLGRIVAKLYDVPAEVIETVFITKVVVPVIEEWLRRQLASKPGPGGVDLAAMVAGIEIDLVSYSRYEGELVFFRRNEQDGYYVEQKRMNKLENVTVEIATITLLTIRRQRVVFNDVSLEVPLASKNVRALNSGFLPEARLKLLHAMKQK